MLIRVNSLQWGNLPVARLFNILFLCAVFQMSPVFVSGATAQIFNVSTTAQLRTALENAAVNGEDDIIILAAGTYKTTDDGLGTFTFIDTEAHNLTIEAAEGLTAADVILDGDNTDQVIRYNNTQASTLILEGISIKNGRTLNSNGGGIATNNNLIVTSSVISNNTASISFTGSGNLSAGGGGIYSSSTVTVTNSIISSNAASISSSGSYNVSAYGGGIYGSDNVTVTDSNISGNAISSLVNGDGGGYGYSSGGGIFGSGTVTVTNSTISGNTSSGAGNCSGSFSCDVYSSGGGISGSDNLTVTNSIISGNTSSGSGYSPYFTGSGYISANGHGYGGGISGGVFGLNGFFYGFTGGAVTVTNSTISSNNAFGSGAGSVNGAGYGYAEGGGIFGFTVTVTNSTISGNSGFGSGYSSGDVYVYGGGISASGDVTVVNSTIFGNSALSGGGIYGSGFITAGILVNNIFSNNSSDIWFTGNCSLYNNYIDYTKLQNANSYVIIKKNNIQPSAGSLNFADASFRLGAGSVAIDMGIDPNSITFTNLFTDPTTLQTVQSALATDKNGNTRIFGAAIDLGAYEYITFPLSISESGAGNGIVISYPAAISCGLGYTNCSANLPFNTFVSLDATPEIGGSIFSGWSGDTDCTDGRVTMNKPISCTASFALCDTPAVAQLGTAPYDSIGLAYASPLLLPVDVIQIIASNQQETLDFKGVTTVTLDGGYNCAFTAPPLLMTTITGSVTVSTGTVIFSNIRIQ